MAVTPRTLDFTNVKDSAKFTNRRVPSGDYLARVSKVEDAKAKGDDMPQYLFTIVLEKYKRDSYPYYCKLVETQLWKLRNLFVAAGIAVPKKRLKLDPNRVVGKLIAVSVDDDEYEGREKSVISQVFPAAELTLDADESPSSETEADEAEEADDDTEEEAEESEGDQFDGMDRTQLKAFIKEHDSSFRFLKSQSDDDLREAARGFTPDEEEEDEAPVNVKKGKPAPEDEELDIDDL